MPTPFAFAQLPFFKKTLVFEFCICCGAGRSPLNLPRLLFCFNRLPRLRGNATVVHALRYFPHSALWVLAKRNFNCECV